MLWVFAEYPRLHGRRELIQPGPGSVAGGRVADQSARSRRRFTWPIRNSPAAAAAARRVSARCRRSAAPRRTMPDRRVCICRAARCVPFTDKQIELVTTFADQAVIAIENARLFDELQARTDDLADCSSSRLPPPTCSRSSAARRSILQAVLDTLVESAARLCEADIGIDLRAERRRTFRVRSRTTAITPNSSQFYANASHSGRPRVDGRPRRAGSAGPCSSPIAGRSGIHFTRSRKTRRLSHACWACRCCAKARRSA